MHTNRVLRGRIALAAIALLALAVGTAVASVSPTSTNQTLAPGGSVTLTKTVSAPAVSGALDLCLVLDLTSSYADDLPTLAQAGLALYTSVATEVAGGQFGVTSFRDQGEYLYRLHRSVTADQAAITAALMSLAPSTTLDSADPLEAQFEAITAAVGPGSFTDPVIGAQGSCGFRANATKLVVVATDSGSHSSADGAPYRQTQATVISALQAQGVTLFGLSSNAESRAMLEPLAAASGGRVLDLSTPPAQMVAAVRAVLGSDSYTVVPDVSSCTAAGLQVTYSPAQLTLAAGASGTMQETITVADTALAGTTATCTVDFRSGATSLGTQAINVTVSADGSPSTTVPGGPTTTTTTVPGGPASSTTTTTTVPGGPTSTTTTSTTVPGGPTSTTTTTVPGGPTSTTTTTLPDGPGDPTGDPTCYRSQERWNPWSAWGLWYPADNCPSRRGDRDVELSD